jgi:hypothetical protein
VRGHGVSLNGLPDGIAGSCVAECLLGASTAAEGRAMSSPVHRNYRGKRTPLEFT